MSTPIEVLAVSLAAAVLWGASPVASKRGFTYGGDPVLVATLVVATGTVLFWGGLGVRALVGEVFVDIPVRGVVAFVAAGLFGTAAGRIANYVGIDRLGANVNSPILATSPLWATALAFVFLGEVISAVQAAGVVVVVAGLVVLTFSRGGDLTGWERRDLLFPLFAAVAFATGYVIRRYALTTTPATPLEGTAINELAALCGLLGYLLARRRPGIFDVPRRGYAYFLAAGVLSSLGLFLFFVGLSLGRVAVVSAMVGTQTLFTTVLSYLLLDDVERVTGGVAVGAVLVVVGVAFITLG